MIQRIQTIYLFLAALNLSGGFFIPFAETKTSQEGIFADLVFTQGDQSSLSIMAILGMVLAIGAIFVYQNRKLQKQISLFLLGFCFGVAGMAFGILAKQAEGVSYSYSFGWVFLLLAALCTLLAMRGISKDEELVKSMDRLR